MYKGSFFLSFEFETKANGFSGTLSGNKIYSIQYFEDTEKLIADTLKVMKSGGNNCSATFEHFDNSSTELCRLFRFYDDTMTFVWWKRDENGFAMGTRTIDKIPINKKEVKKYVLLALEMFREYDSKIS